MCIPCVVMCLSTSAMHISHVATPHVPDLHALTGVEEGKLEAHVQIILVSCSAAQRGNIL